MLKIKDNINLKELEKFGFKQDKYKVLYLYQENPFTGLRVEIETRRIGLFNSADIIVEKKVLNVLFDLIESGYVEKVEE